MTSNKRDVVRKQLIKFLKDDSNESDTTDVSKKASTVIKYIGSEDYLSLIIALEDGSAETVRELIRTALSNVKNGVDECRIGTIEKSHRKRIYEWLSSRKIAHRIDDDVLYASTSVGVALKLREYATGDKYETRQGSIAMKKNRPSPTVRESVLGMTKVKSLQRMCELAGVQVPEQEPDVIMPPEEDVFAPGDVSPVVSPVVPAPTIDPVSSSVPMATPAVGLGVDFSPEYQEANEALDRIAQLVMDMKISEFKLFVGKAEEFHQRVCDIGRTLLSDVGA